MLESGDEIVREVRTLLVAISLVPGSLLSERNRVNTVKIYRVSAEKERRYSTNPDSVGLNHCLGIVFS